MTYDARILLTSSREFSDRSLMIKAFKEAIFYIGSQYKKEKVNVTLVQGGARGGDRLGISVASAFKWAVETHLADWDEHGKAAGMIRNKKMVDLGADVCVSLTVGGLPCYGTRHCTSLAEKAEIHVIRHEQEYPEPKVYVPRKGL